MLASLMCMSSQGHEEGGYQLVTYEGRVGGTQQGARTAFYVRLAVRCTAPASTPQLGADRAGLRKALGPARAYGRRARET